jgi:hypothetical protein
MSDHELRDLLHRVVPDAPTPDPRGPVVLARRWRSRRRTGLAVGVAAVVAAVAGVVLPVSVPTGSDEAGGRPSPAPTSAAPELALDPYDANTCPPQSEPTPTRSVVLDDVVAIAQCSYTERPTKGQPAVPLTPEAYVDDMVVFARAAAATLPRLDETTCRSMSSLTPGALVFHHRDGSATTVPADQCEMVRVGRTPVVARFLTGAFAESLSRQRDRYDYPTPSPVVPTCDGRSVSGPVRPAREVLVGAVVCSGLDRDVRTLHRLDDSETAALQRGWADAEDLPAGDSGFCVGSPDEPRYVLAATDRGDLVHLQRSNCGDYLLLRHLAIRVRFTDLGVR